MSAYAFAETFPLEVELIRELLLAARGDQVVDLRLAENEGDGLRPLDGGQHRDDCGGGVLFHRFLVFI